MPEPSFAYTMVGHQGEEGNDRYVFPHTVILLHRTRRFERAEVFERLHRLNAREIISVESVSPRYDVESYTNAYREFKFLFPGEPLPSPGTAINLAMREVRTSWALVLWSDTLLQPVSKAHLEQYDASSTLLYTPHLRSPGGDLLPTLGIPAEYRRGLRVLMMPPGAERDHSIMPFDYLGLYHKERFIQSLGYDDRLTDPWWQKLDFGFRSWLWGMEIRASSGLRMQALGDLEPQDTSVTPGYERFYARNLLVEYLQDHAHLGWKHFLAYRRARGQGLRGALNDFREHRAWVHRHRYHFRTEARVLCDRWEDTP